MDTPTRQTAELKFRLSPGLKARIAEAATGARRSQSDWIRIALEDACTEAEGGV